jgi:hypothetical protein
MREIEREAVIAEFIRANGITRCPTACVSATQASVGAADRTALEEYALTRDRSRREKIAIRSHALWVPGRAN